MIKDKLKKALAKASGVKGAQIEPTENEAFGDYSSNVALGLKNPKKAAEEIAGKLNADKGLAEAVEKVEVAGPGFINFYLSKKALFDTLLNITNEKDIFGRNREFEGKKLMFEFGQPNTHKVPHIGHLYSYIFGSAMANILEANGYTLFRANYQGDIGPHVAKCLWALMKEKPEIPESLGKKVRLLQKMYQTGSRAYEDDDEAKGEIDEINKKIYAKDSEITNLWEETKGWSLDFYKEFEKRLGIAFDHYYFESQVEQEGKKVVSENVPDVFEKSEGAIIFPGSKYGLHDRVFVTGKNTPTYEAKDLALEWMKYKDWPYDLLIITTASEQNGYFQVVFRAIEEIHPELKGKLKHLGFGMVNIKTGKMSSRTGEIIGAIDLVDIVVARIKEIVAAREDLTEEEKNKIAEKVGMGAVKYSFLKNNPLQDTKFDIEESISEEGNSGPYLQYTVARTNSVLAKSHTFKGSTLQGEYSNLNKEELSVLRTLIRYSDVIKAAADSYSPNVLANYLFDLAQKYNNFYNKYRILKSENEDFRLSMTSAVGQVIKNGLGILGIETLERM